MSRVNNKYPRIVKRVRLTKKQDAEYKEHSRLCSEMTRIWDAVQKLVSSPIK